MNQEQVGVNTTEKIAIEGMIRERKMEGGRH